MLRHSRVFVASLLAMALGPSVVQAQPQFDDAVMFGNYFEGGLSLPLGEVVSIAFGDGSVGVSVRDPETGAEVSVGANFPAGRLRGLEDGSVCIEFEASVAFESGFIESASLTGSLGYYGEATYTLAFDESAVSDLERSASEHQTGGGSGEASVGVEFCPVFNRPLVMTPRHTRNTPTSDARDYDWTSDDAQPMALLVREARQSPLNAWQSVRTQRPSIRLSAPSPQSGVKMRFEFEVRGDHFCLNAVADTPDAGSGDGSEDYVHFELGHATVERVEAIAQLDEYGGWLQNQCMWALAHSLGRSSIFPSIQAPLTTFKIAEVCRPILGLPQLNQ